MDLSRFGAAPPWSLGVEEELMLVDAETLEPARDGFSRVFGEATERIKPELFESFVEITTTVVETPEEAETELRALRHEVAERAAANGLALLATGSHPTARGGSSATWMPPLLRRPLPLMRTSAADCWKQGLTCWWKSRLRQRWPMPIG